MLNQNLLIILICIVLGIVLYLFYWSRLVAFLISQGIRLAWWSQEAASVWVEIGSIDFSLISGRILLKEVKYHSSNQTVKILKAQIQWRYWIRRPATEKDIPSAQGEDINSRGPPCRVQISFQGVEWFLYNRTAAYDNIIAQMEKRNAPVSRPTSSRNLLSRLSGRVGDSLPFSPPSVVRSPFRLPQAFRRFSTWLRKQLPNLDPKEILPLGIDVETGIIILGNSSTPNLLVAEFRSAHGMFGLLPSRSPFDLYKQNLNLRFQSALIQLVANDDYVDPMATTGGLLSARLRQRRHISQFQSYQPYRPFAKLWKQLRLFNLVINYFDDRRAFRQSSRTLKAPLLGFRKRAKAADEETPIGIDYSTHDYAIERKILETSRLDLTYYLDVVGDVPKDVPKDVSDSDPEWGIHLIINGGIFNYGPWADRQRAELQRLFFPPSWQNMEVTHIPGPGEKRIWAALQIFVELRESTILHLPFREASKDWQWDGRAHIPGRPRKRESAVIDIMAGDRSTISYNMPMIVGASGYESAMEVHLDDVVVTSSSNDIRLLCAESARIRAELPSPLAWDEERTWRFAVSLRQPVLSLLRDHVNMITDLGRDWVSGPPTDYQKFVPMIYVFDMKMHHYELNLYLNDQNVIDKPLIKDENVLLTAQGSLFKFSTTIASNVYRPDTASVPLSMTIPDITASISLPRWNTHAIHAPKDGFTICRADQLDIEGSYRYFSEVHQENVDKLQLDFKARRPTLRLHGWLIRHLMALKDNYFGSFTHFQTLSEYLDKRKRGEPVGDPILLKYRAGKANMMEVGLTLFASNIRILLPTDLMGSGASGTLLPVSKRVNHVRAYDCVCLTVPELQVLVRMHDYFLEMSVNVDTISASLSHPEILPPLSPAPGLSRGILTIDGLGIVANRLFGPQPNTSTYVCIWEITTGDVTASMSIPELDRLVAALNAFKVNFVDAVNAPATEFLPLIHPDVTFYKVQIKKVEVTLKDERTALCLQCDGGIKIDTNDLGTDSYKRVLSVRVPTISTKLLVLTSAGRRTWLEASRIDLDVFLDIYSAPIGYQKANQEQLAFIEEQDEPTGRTKGLFDLLRRGTSSGKGVLTHGNNVYLPRLSPPSRRQAQQPKKVFIPQTRRPHTPSWRASTYTNLSDSEDDGMSEADRDALVAKTRTSTPIATVLTNEDHLSSGEESDDADLTDGESSEDEWSQQEDPTSHRRNYLLSFYSPFVARYEGRGRDQQFFACIKPGLLSNPDGNRLEFEERTVSPVVKLSSSDDFGSTSLTTIRCRSKRGLSVQVNPLVVLAAESFATATSSMICDLSLELDSLIATCIEERLKEHDPTSLIFDIAVPSISARLLHHIVLPKDYDVERHTHLHNIPTASEATGVVDAHLQRFSVVGSTCPGRRSITASMARTQITLNASLDKKKLITPHVHEALVDLAVSDSQLHISSDSLNSSVGEISLHMDHRSPEYASALATALPSTQLGISTSLAAIQDHRRLMTRQTIGTLVLSSSANPVIDPLSTSQPSYFVQTGAPRLLRTDVAFRFLYHLRTELWNSIKDGGKVYLNTDSDDNELVSLIDARLRQLDQDVSYLDDSFFLQGILKETIHQSSKSTKSLHSYSISVGRLSLVVLEPQGGTSSYLSIRDARVAFHSKTNQLIQLNLTGPSSMSQSSLRQKGTRQLRSSLLVVSSSDVSVVVLPHLMEFAQHILRVQRHRKRRDDLGHASLNLGADRIPIKPPKWQTVQVVLSMRRIRLQAAAQNLVLVVGLHALQTTSDLLTMAAPGQMSSTHAILFDEAYLQARSPTEHGREGDQDVLASLTFLTGRVSAVLKPGASTKLVTTLTGLRLNMPRSALRLYRFVEEWREDYLPGMEGAFNDLLSEYNAKPQTAPRTQAPSPSLQIHGQINHFEITLQVMHGTWASLEINKAVAYYTTPDSAPPISSHTFGLQIASIILSISTKQGYRDTPGSRVKIVLPPLTLGGLSDGYHVDTTLLFEFIELKVKPSHWDTLLAVQQKFGQDFNDIVGLMDRTRTRKRKSTPVPVIQHPVKINSFEYSGSIKMRGFRVGLEGVGSVLYLECQDINGSISNKNGWAGELGLSDLALSLGPRTMFQKIPNFTRNHRSAFVTIDFKVDSAPNVENGGRNLNLAVGKTHAVLQPSSIGEFGDFIDNIQAEFLERQEQRAMEMAAFKEKTRKIMETFDVNLAEMQEEKQSWFSDVTLHVQAKNIGVSFPLTREEIERYQSTGKTSVRAFLFAIQSIDFGIVRGETGTVLLKRLSVQFVPSFRQSQPLDFTSEQHQTRNRLLYPEMKANLRMSMHGNLRKISVAAEVSGFLLDLDSSIPNYVFSLVDVYRLGKARVERLSAIVPKTPLTPLTFEAVRPPAEKRYGNVPITHIVSDFVFLSGKVRLFSSSASATFERRNFSLAQALDISDSQTLEMGAEVFKLPVLSVWAEYKTAPAPKIIGNGDEPPSMLMFKCTVHSSHNTLRPTLLPFITELVERVETRMRKASLQVLEPPIGMTPLSSMTSTFKERTPPPKSSLHVCFGLRIDRSKLELTCQPDVNVVAGLHWESGGFLVNISPGAKKVALSGSVGGLTIGLKHGFLSEDCVRLDMRNLTFSVSFAKAISSSPAPLSSISVVLDTEILGGVRFSRLQDILCFKAVWLDHIPIFNANALSDSKHSLAPSVEIVEIHEEEEEKQLLTTSILLRARHINLDIDLGQSITSLNLALDDTIFRTTITEESNEVFLFVDDVRLVAKGNLSGSGRVPSCIFQTIRRSEGFVREGRDRSRMLELRLTSGALIVDLESDRQRLLHYRAEPIEVEIVDDWSMIDPKSPNNNQSLQLSFTITSPEIVLITTIGTIPKLVSYANKFKANLETQRQGAYRESQTFRVTRHPKPDNPLSAVAEAMLHTARSRFKEAETELSYDIHQQMSLRLVLLRLVVFPRTMKDSEFAQFVAYDIQSRLNRSLGSDLIPAQRDIQLSFSSMAISKYSRPGQPIAPMQQSDPYRREWLATLFKDATEAIIVGLPAMTMHMITEEQIQEAATDIIYDFFSEFVRREGMQAIEDIYITLNMSLYAWLTLLRKTLTREMDQVRAAEDWRPTSTSGVSRKRPPEPLVLSDSPRSGSQPSSAVGAMSPLNPLSPRQRLEYLKSPLSAREPLSAATSIQASPLPAKEPGDDFLVSRPPPRRVGFDYKPRKRQIERLTMRQLGEATPDVMHPFFMKKAGFNLEDSLPQYVNEYATLPLEEIMAVLLRLYSRQLLSGRSKTSGK